MIVLFYDRDSGAVTECAVGPAASMQADGRPFVEVSQYRPNWDATHRVVDGRVVPI